MAVPVKISQRITNALKRYQPILNNAKERDVNESDTVMIVTDLLSDLFGYDKYDEITSEHAIRGTYCDLALKIGDTLRVLIEVKSIGIDFRDTHIKQAIDYAANQGVEWVLLTNGAVWRAYKVVFAKPIDFIKVLEIDLLTLNLKDTTQIELLYLLTREGVIKNAIDDYLTHVQATSRHLIAAIILEDSVLQCIRRELKRLNSNIRIETDEIKNKLIIEVLKREVIEGEEADNAKNSLIKAKKIALKASKKAPIPETIETDNSSNED